MALIAPATVGRMSGFLFALVSWCFLVSCDATRLETAEQSSTPASLHVITSGGFAAAFNILEPMFEAKAGVDLIASYGASSGGAHDSIPVRLQRGEQFDVVIMSRPALDRLTAQGEIQVATLTDLVESNIGMAVKSGAPEPDISTEDAFLKVLREAESIGYSASSSGTWLSTELWPKLGVWQDIQSKSVRIETERVATVVARRDVEIGFQQISEILPIAGAEFVAPIPESLQRTTVFSAAIVQGTQRLAIAQSLIEFLSSREVAPVIQSTGLIPVILKEAEQAVQSQ